MDHGRRWRWTFLGRMIVGLVVLFSGAAGISIYAAQQANQYACLRIDGYTLLDVNNNTHFIDSRPKDIGYPAAIIYGSAQSPNHQHVAYLGPGQYGGTLYIQSGEAPSVPIAARVDYMSGTDWSPDSSKFAYSWMSDHRLRLSVVRADGSQATTIADNGDPSLYMWSSQGKYLAYIVGSATQRHLVLWSLDNHRLATLSQQLSSINGLAFDANDQHVAFEWSDSALNHWISVGSPDQTTATQFMLPPTSYDFHLLWSPDGKFVAMQYRAHWPEWRFAIYGTDGSSMPDITEAMDPSEAPADPLMVWSADSHSLTYLLQYPDQRFDLGLYKVTSGTLSALATGLHTAPVYSPHKDRLALYSADGRGVDVMDVGGGNQSAFIHDAKGVGPIQWSADDKQIAVAWASSAPNAPGLTLSWMQADGSNRHDLHDNLSNTDNFIWLNGSQQLAFVGAHDGHYNVELVDASTGVESRLLDGLTQIPTLHFDSAKQLLTFWWRTEKAAGADAYSLDGSRVYRLPVLGAIDDSAKLFWSPDGTTAAFNAGGPGQQSLEIAKPGDAVPIVVQSGLTSLSDPVWTPDSAQLAFTLSTGPGLKSHSSLVVTSANGAEIRHFDEFGDVYHGLSWSRCG